jgi:hypothetical protein
MRARIEGIPGGPRYCDAPEVDGQPPSEVTIADVVRVCWGDMRPDEHTLPLLHIEAGVAVYGPRSA